LILYHKQKSLSRGFCKFVR